MSFDDFLDEVAPGDDNPQRTFLILKYKKWTQIQYTDQSPGKE
jgi:hypothetical protein